MKSVLSSSLAVLMFFFLFVASERRAWGYVDPGSGLLALQSIASVMTGCLYFMRRRIRSLLFRKPDQDQEVQPLAAAPRDARKVA